MRIHLSADGPDARALLRAVARTPDFADPPLKLKVDNKTAIAPAPGWVDEAIGRSANFRVHAVWAGADGSEYTGAVLFSERSGVVCWDVPRDAGPDDWIESARRLPLEVLVVGRAGGWDAATTSFADGHREHGAGVVFRGDGAARLVSPRWLEHGPWLLRRDGDLAYVQFHRLDADPATAWAQAERAHARIGIDPDVGGYLHHDHAIRTRISGLLDAERTLTVTRGAGQPMSQAEMLDLCAHRRRESIARVRVVFMEERDARRHLHELWLRELECWYFDADGRETRADDTYTPERIAPEWAEGAAAPRPVTARISLGIGALLADPEGALPGGWCRDDLLMHLLDHHTPGDTYEVREVMGAHVPRASASAGEEGELVVVARPGVGGALPPAKAAPLLTRVAATPAQVELRVPPERIGLSLPAVIVPDPYVDQRPLRFGDDHPLRGVVVHAVGDVLARVRSLGRDDLRPLESLLALCANERFVLTAS